MTNRKTATTSAGTTSARRKFDGKPVEAEILEAEWQLLNAVLAGNAEQLEQLLADEGLFVGPTGHLLTKEEDLEAHRSGHLWVQSLEPLEIEMHVVGEGGAVALAVSLLRLSGTFVGHLCRRGVRGRVSLHAAVAARRAGLARRG